MSNNLSDEEKQVLEKSVLEVNEIYANHSIQNNKKPKVFAHRLHVWAQSRYKKNISEEAIKLWLKERKTNANQS